MSPEGVEARDKQEYIDKRMLESGDSTYDVNMDIANMQGGILDKVDGCDIKALPKLDRDRFKKQVELAKEDPIKLQQLEHQLDDIIREYEQVKSEISRINPDILQKYEEDFWKTGLEKRPSELKTLKERDKLRGQYEGLLKGSDVFKDKPKLVNDCLDFFIEQSVTEQQKWINKFPEEEKPRKELKAMGEELIKVLPSKYSKKVQETLKDYGSGKAELISFYNQLDEDLNKEFETNLKNFPDDKFSAKAKDYARKYFYSLNQNDKFGVNTKMVEKAKNLDFIKKAFKLEAQLNMEFAGFENSCPRFFKLKEEGWEKLGLEKRQELVKIGKIYQSTSKDYEKAKDKGWMSEATYEKYMNWLDVQSDSVADIENASKGWQNEESQLKDIYDKFESIKFLDPDFYSKNRPQFMKGRRSERLQLLDGFEKQSGISFDKDPNSMEKMNMMVKFARTLEESKVYDKAIEQWEEIGRKYPEYKAADKEIERLRKLSEVAGESSVSGSGKSKEEIKKAAENVVDKSEIANEVDKLDLQYALKDLSDKNEEGLGQRGDIKGAMERSRRRAVRDGDKVAQEFLDGKEAKDKDMIIDKKGKAKKVMRVDLGKDSAWSDANKVAKFRRKIELDEGKRANGAGGAEEIDMYDYQEGRQLTGREAQTRLDKKQNLLVEETVLATINQLGLKGDAVNDNQITEIRKAAIAAAEKKSKERKFWSEKVKKNAA